MKPHQLELLIANGGRDRPGSQPGRHAVDGTSRIEPTATDPSDQYAELWALLVPSSGPAGVVQGEVLRLAGKISREIAGNGSVNWSDDFQSMTDALGLHLASGTTVSDELAPALVRIRSGVADDAELGSVRDRDRGRGLDPRQPGPDSAAGTVVPALS